LGGETALESFSLFMDDNFKEKLEQGQELKKSAMRGSKQVNQFIIVLRQSAIENYRKLYLRK
jgi:hypothetical protein